MDRIIDESRAPADWVEALAESEADIKAGRIVSLEPVLSRAQESIDRMEARRVAQATQPARSR